MFKLIKYDLKGNYKFVLGNILMVIILNLSLITRRGTWSSELIATVSAVIFIASTILIFIESIKLMSRYMKGDEGYLLLTLPQKGYSILLSRLLASLIELLIVFLVGFMFLRNNIINVDVIVQGLKNDLDIKIIINLFLGSIANIILLLALIYFSIVISKVAFKNKKIGGVGAFFIFLAILFLLNYLAYELSNLFHASIYYGDLYARMDVNVAVLGGQLKTVVKSSKINIPSLIYNLIIFIGLFTGTSYMLEKKVDL